MAAKLKDKDSIDAIISEMTIEEKAACITGGSSFSSRPMEKYGIPRMILLDGGTGYNESQMLWEKVFQEYLAELEAAGETFDEESCVGRMGGMEVILNNEKLLKERTARLNAVKENPKARGCYPPGMTFGATWNPQVIEKCGHALGKEMNAAGIDVLLGSPNVNISRDPLNGRLFEGYSEDPCLVSKLAPHFACAIQDEGVIADVKHFAANNQETDRMGVNEMISERALREIYLPGFKAVVQAGCKTVMSAYNKINGVPSAQNRWLLHDVLRDEWGFEGFVMSDWSASYNQVESVAAGNDLIMPGPRALKPVLDAVADGRLKEESLDECVRNILRVVLESPAMKGRLESFDINEGIEAAYDAAAEAVTLLKNDGVLPLKADARPAIYGKYSKKMMAAGAGSADVITSLNTNIYDCAVDTFGSENVCFGEVRDDSTVVIVTVGSAGQEGADRQNMLMDADDREALDTAVAEAKKKNIPVVVLMNIAGPIQVYDWEKDADAILCIFLPGMEGGRAAVDVLTGKVNPSGKLPLTFPKEYRDCPTYGNFPGYDSEVWYGEGIYVGYRFYEKKGIEVMYPFGYGLSYTTFKIYDAKAPSAADIDKGDVEVSVRVKNTGNRPGAEVVQLYVNDVTSTLDKPLKELKDFKKVFLNPGEEKEVTLKLTKDDFASYDKKLGSWAAEPGEFRLLIGNASDNITTVLDIDITCENPYGIGPATDIVKVVSNTAAVDIVKNVAGVSLMETAGSYIVFQPLATFNEVWHNCIIPIIRVDEETSERMQAEIYAGWKKIS